MGARARDDGRWRTRPFEVRLLQAISGLFVGFGASYGVVTSNRVLILAILLAIFANVVAWVVQGSPRGWWLTLVLAAAVLLVRDAPIAALPNCADVDPSVACVAGDVRPRLVATLAIVVISMIAAAFEAVSAWRARRAG
jgi:hypothetical protein